MFHNNKGFSLIFAIFLLIVFAIIGTAILTMLSTSSLSSSEDLISTQAFFLAESGAEIRIFQLISNNDSSQSKSYYFSTNSNYKIYTHLKKLADLPDSRKLYKVRSTGKISEIQRTIKIKFWY